METAFSLGSNVGGRLRLLSQAKTLILLESGVRFVDQSSVYETEPVDVNDEYMSLKFLNAVLLVESDLTPQEWLPKVKNIEKLLHRERSEDRNAPRTIDIDILFCGNEIVDTDLLTIPHPRWSERRFVLEPLAEIRSDFVVPGSECPVRKLLDSMPSNDDVRLFTERW